MAFPYCIYDVATGRIEVSREDPDHMAGYEQHYLLAGKGVAYGPSDGQLHYVVDGIIEVRPSFAIPDVLTLAVGEEVTLSLPIGTTIVCDGEELGVTDGNLVMEGEVPGEYIWELSNFPYLPKTLTLTVTP